jgi:hypothetical protein
MVFYPMDGGRRLEEAEVKEEYPETWAYLKKHERELKSRKALSKQGTSWWRPLWLRDPALLFSPKIVCPHLMLTPRFAVDRKGRFAVTHSPFLVPTEENRGGGDDFLNYLVAVLNSAVGFWQISVQSHKYSRQYAMVENKTLALFRIPNPRAVPARFMQKLIALVDRRLDAGFSPELESRIDKTIAELYGLNDDDLNALGIA